MLSTIFYGIIAKKVWALLVSLSMFFTPIVDSSATSTDTAKLIGEDTFVLAQAAIMGQGLTNDGEYYYTSGAMTALHFVALSKVDMETKEVVDFNLLPLPLPLIERGNNHIGGISYYDGYIYASVEDGDEKYPCIVVFDCDTLTYVKHYELSLDIFPTGIPWCAVDGENDRLYASSWSKDPTLEIYRLSDMTHLKSLELSEPLDRIQGAECYDGKIYLSYDIKNDGQFKRVQVLDPETGVLELLMTRDVGREDFETEGMTITPSDEGPVFHILDYNKLATVYIRQYTAVG